MIGTKLAEFWIKRAKLDSSGLSADRTYTLPDRSGTLADDTDITGAKARANHTGTQAASTISDFNAAALIAAPPEDPESLGEVIAGAASKSTPTTNDLFGISDSAAANDLKKFSWGNLRTALDAIYQALNSDLTTIGSLSPTNDDILQRKSGAWTSRTAAQYKTDLALVKADVGLGNVDNTSNATERAASATLTNKDLKSSTNTIEEITTTASSSTPTPTGGSLRNFFTVTALAANPTFAAPSGTPQNGNQLIIRIKDNGTGRTISWNAIYRSVAATLPTSTTANKTSYVGLKYNAADSKWDCIAYGQEA